MKKNIIILILFVFGFNSFSQTYTSAMVYLSDTVVIRLHDYVGEIQWQKTYEINNPGSWQNISAANADTLLIIADTTTFYRAKVIAGNCEPFYSDTAMVVIHPIDQALSQVEGGIPEDEYIDINNDGQYDFEIILTRYNSTDYPPSGIVINRFIQPLNDNKFLFEGLEFPYGSPILEYGDIIKKHNNVNATWRNTGISVIFRTGVLTEYNENEGVYVYEWPNNWNISYNLCPECDFYLGFKLISGSTEEIGWMLLDINIENGKISIVESEMTSEDELIIE